MTHHFLFLFPSLHGCHSLLHTDLHLLVGLDLVSILTVLRENLRYLHLAHCLFMQSLWLFWEYQELSGS